MSTPSTRPSTPSSTPKPTIDPVSHPAHKLLARAYPTDEAKVTQIFTDKIAHKPLLLSSTEHTEKRAARRHLRLRKKAYALKHARPKPLSAKEKRDLGLYALKPEECQYAVYLGLHRLWRRYILEVMGYLDRDGKVVEGRVGSAASANGAGALIASADFHGMEVEVVRCVDLGRVGLKGIVVRETRSTFTVVCNKEGKPRRKKRKTDESAGNNSVAGSEENAAKGAERQDKVRMILKKGTVFRVVVDLPSPNEATIGKVEPARQKDAGEPVISQSSEASTKRRLIFELHGDQLETRPIERATKKFKWKSMDYL